MGHGHALFVSEYRTETCGAVHMKTRVAAVVEQQVTAVEANEWRQSGVQTATVQRTATAQQVATVQQVATLEGVAASECAAVGCLHGGS